MDWNDLASTDRYINSRIFPVTIEAAAGSKKDFWYIDQLIIRVLSFSVSSILFYTSCNHVVGYPAGH